MTTAPAPAEGALAWHLDLFVDGQAATKGSAFAVKSRSTGRPMLKVDNEAAQKEWTTRVRMALRGVWLADPTAEAVRLRLDFVRRRRDSAPVTFSEHHIRKPDGDKLERATWDALTGHLWLDDAQVIEWSGTKREAELGERYGVRIRFATIPPLPRPSRDHAETSE